MGALWVGRVLCTSARREGAQDSRLIELPPSRMPPSWMSPVTVPRGKTAWLVHGLFLIPAGSNMGASAHFSLVRACHMARPDPKWQEMTVSPQAWKETTGKWHSWWAHCCKWRCSHQMKLWERSRWTVGRLTVIRSVFFNLIHLVMQRYFESPSSLTFISSWNLVEYAVSRPVSHCIPLAYPKSLHPILENSVSGSVPITEVFTWLDKNNRFSPFPCKMTHLFRTCLSAKARFSCPRVH